MAKQLELLEKLPRKPSQKRMYVCDASHEGKSTVRLSCYRCGHETEWLEFDTITEAKRGLPCPICNKETT